MQRRHAVSLFLQNKDKSRILTNRSVSREEVIALHEQFRSLCVLEYLNEETSRSQGGINKAAFKKLTSRLGSTPNLVTDRIFFIYDLNQNNVVGFSEYVTIMSALTKGSKVERLRCAFRAYDTDEDGYVTKLNLMDMFAGYFDLSNNLVGFMLRSAEEEIVDWDIVQEQNSLSSVFGSQIPSLMDMPLQEIPDKDHEEEWNIDNDSESHEKSSAPLNDAEYDAELKRITMSAIDKLVSEIFIAAGPEAPEKGLSWEEFRRVALDRAKGIYMGILTCWLDSAAF